jgi:AraC-like DNA-binding protein
MAIHTSYATGKPGEAEEVISAAYVDVDLTLADDHDPFRFNFDRFDGGAFQLDTMAIVARAAVSYEPDQEYVVSTVRQGTLRVLQRGADERFLPGEVALIARPGAETRLEFADLREGVVQLGAASLRAAAGLDPAGKAVPEFGSIRPISDGHARTWLRGVRFVAATLNEDPAVLDSPLVVGASERLLAELLLATFANSAHAAPGSRVDGHARSPATLRRAVAYIEANAEGDIGIEDIAAAARVSRRAVQQSFRRHLDTTPTAYLRGIRLDAAHRELLDASPEVLTVTEVAYRWGFSSPSRFSERYRAAFGTTPSATLRR